VSASPSHNLRPWPSNLDVGANCDLNTTADAIVPGIIKEEKNMVLQVFRLRLNDSGLNGIFGDSDDRNYAMQGLFVP
jgi:hypothetical protein